jgi:hypothetical protein
VPSQDLVSKLHFRLVWNTATINEDLYGLSDGDDTNDDDDENDNNNWTNKGSWNDFTTTSMDDDDSDKVLYNLARSTMILKERYIW